MPATKVKLTGGSFQDSEGNLMQYGYLTMKLSQDGSVAGVGNIASGITLKILLDGNASVEGTTALVLTAAAAAVGGSSTYTGTISGGANNAFVGLYFVVAGFVASAGVNNGTFICTASTATTLTLANASGINETHAGTATASQAVWGNDQILPANSYYRVTGYTAEGQPAWGPNNQQITGNGGSYDIGTWVPNHVVTWTPSIQVPEIEVNTVAADSQTLLDFTDSDTVTFEDLGSGQITAHAGSSSFQRSLSFNGNTNGVTNWVGAGIAGAAYPYGQSGQGCYVQLESPQGSDELGISINIGGDSAQEAQLYEVGDNFGAWNIYLDGAPIRLLNLNKWEAKVRIGTRYLAAWAANVNVPAGTIVQDSGNYYVQTNFSTPPFTGTTIPAFNSTPGASTTDNSGTAPYTGTAAWRCIGTTRPCTRSHHWIGLLDYNGTLGGAGYYQIMQVYGWRNSDYPAGYALQRGANFAGFTVNPNLNATATIHVYVGGENLTPVLHDTGIVPDPDGVFQTFKIVPVGNTLTFYIDGVLVYTSGDVSALSTSFYSYFTADNQVWYNYGAYTWVQNTDYGKGTVLYNGGAWWSAVVGGTSAAGANPLMSPTSGAVVTDNTITWQCQGNPVSREPALGIAVNYVLWE